jgi:hypothetical protein
MSKAAVIICLSLAFLGIIVLFWRNEWVYSQPTPVPVDYKPVNLGSVIDVAGKFKYAGAGQSLHSCREIMESHSGTLAISSMGPGKGALTSIQFKL